MYSKAGSTDVMSFLSFANQNHPIAQSLKNTPSPSMISSSRSSSSSNRRPSTSRRTPRKLGTSAANKELQRCVMRAPSDCFVYKHGSRHHAFSKAEVPYPLSYDKAILDLDSSDHSAITKGLGGNVTTIQLQAPPRRVLDLGCGEGSWMLEAANLWPDTLFVGFDLVPLQPNVSRDPTFAGRIQWVHGNFLTSKLPFPDGYFDFVHARGLGMAVPEDKWDYVVSETARVLAPGGQVEFLVDDIVFPFIPLPSTHPLAKKRSRRMPSPSPGPSVIPPAVAGAPTSMLSPRAQDALTLYSPQPEYDEDLNDDGSRPPQHESQQAIIRDWEILSPPLSLSKTPPAPLLNGASGISGPTVGLPVLTKQVSKSSGSDGSVYTTDPSKRTYQVGPSSSARPLLYDIEPPRHAHEWLAELFYSVWERRFINLNPTSMLANVLNMYFSKVTTGPRWRLPLPAEGAVFSKSNDESTANSQASTTMAERSRASSLAGHSVSTATASTAVSPSTLFSHLSKTPASSYSRSADSMLAYPPSPSTVSTFESTISPTSPTSPAIVIDGLPSQYYSGGVPTLFAFHPQSPLPISKSNLAMLRGGSPIQFTKVPYTPEMTIPESPLLSLDQTFTSLKGIAPFPPASLSKLHAPLSITTHHFAKNPPLQPNQSRPSSIFSRPGTANGPGTNSLLLGLPLEINQSTLQSAVSPRDRAKSNATMPGWYPSYGSMAAGPATLALGGEALVLQVERAFRLVVGCKEAMWEEFLEQQHWIHLPDKDAQEKRSKERRAFETAFENYIVDMQSRTSLPEAVVRVLGWKRPRKPPLTPVQQMEERRRKLSQISKPLQQTPRHSTSDSPDWHLLSPDADGGPKRLFDIPPSKAQQDVDRTSTIFEETQDDSEDACIFRGVRAFTGMKVGN